MATSMLIVVEAAAFLFSFIYLWIDFSSKSIILYKFEQNLMSELPYLDRGVQGGDNEMLAGNVGCFFS